MQPQAVVPAYAMQPQAVVPAPTANMQPQAAMQHPAVGPVLGMPVATGVPVNAVVVNQPAIQTNNQLGVNETV